MAYALPCPAVSIRLLLMLGMVRVMYGVYSAMDMCTILALIVHAHTSWVAAPEMKVLFADFVFVFFDKTEGPGPC